MVIKELCEQKLIKLNNIINLLAFARLCNIPNTQDKPNNNEPQSSDSNENGEHKESILNTTAKKIIHCFPCADPSASSD
jgi:hypothetical protein